MGCFEFHQEARNLFRGQYRLAMMARNLIVWLEVLNTHQHRAGMFLESLT